MILSQCFSIVASIIKLPFSYLSLNYQVNYFKFLSEGDTYILNIICDLFSHHEFKTESLFPEKVLNIHHELSEGIEHTQQFC